MHLTEEEKTELDRLATGTEGWPWLREDDTFVGHLPLNQWKVLYARWRAAQGERPGLEALIGIFDEPGMAPATSLDAFKTCKPSDRSSSPGSKKPK